MSCEKYGRASVEDQRINTTLLDATDTRISDLQNGNYAVAIAS